MTKEYYIGVHYEEGMSLRIKADSEDEAREINSVESDLISADVPKEIAERIAQLSTIFSVLDIADIAAQEDKDIEMVANLYFKVGVRLQLHWFLDQITRQAVANHWQALARTSFREELDWQQRSLTLVVLKCGCDVKMENIDAMFDSWMQKMNKLLRVGNIFYPTLK